MEAPVSVSLGVVLSLPAKLGGLVSPETGNGLRKGERNKIRRLKDHLQELIDKYLIEPSEVEAPTSTARCWVKEVRELSYDIDDFLDELIHRLHGGGGAANQKNLQGKVARIREGLTRSRWVADEISRFRARLEEAIQRHKRYNLDKLQSRPNRIDTEDEDESPIRAKAACLVGIDSSMKKLEEWLTGDGERQLRVASIVGFGGIGKTTLAKELYCRLGWQFECRAFARSSHKPDMWRLLTSILLQIRRHRLPNDLELANLTGTIRSYLQDRKYFIVIDDLWDASQWDIIHRALPDDKCCSRVLTTTEIDILAQRCCGHSSKHIFNMEPLCDKGSSELFFSKFSVNQSGNCEEFNKVLFEIIRKCGGFPLATIATASILARQQGKIEHYNLISRSLSMNLRTNPTIEGMKQVLSLCYDNLPGRLKACMLYLSIYKEDQMIWKTDLVKQWITEGFICETQGKHMEEVAGSYFDELVNAGMIQPVDIKYNGEVLSCTVHYMVLNVIRYRSIEENFVTAIDYCQTNTSLADKVRRLSLHFGDVDDVESPAKLRVTQVRSLVFYGFFKSLPSIAKFRFLRVLVIHLWGDRDNISLDLTTVGKYFRLRNLNIACNVTLNLQIKLQDLEYLEILKIDSRLTEVPQEIVLLPSLLHLSFPGDTNLPNGIGHMTSLHTLGCFDLSSNSADNVRSLGVLSNVRDLRLTCSAIQCDNLLDNVACLASVLSKLSNLKSLNLSPVVCCSANTLEASSPRNIISFDGLSRVSSPPALLEKLEFSPRICIFSRFPRWIGELGKLSVVKVATRELWQSDIDILSRLNALSALSLYVRTAPVERIIFHKEGFAVLIYFKFTCSSPCLSFKKEAMPSVRRFKIGFSAKTLVFVVGAGFENLTGLELLSAKIGGAGSNESVRETVQSALEHAFGNRKGNLIINVQLVDRIFYGDTEMSMVAQKERCQTLEKPDVITKPDIEGQCRIGELSSSEDTKIRDDDRSRITLSLESSAHTENPGTGSKNRSKNATDTNTFGTKTSASSSSVPLTPRTKTEIQESSNVRKFTFSELKGSTKNFRPDSLLGEGGFGSVFKGWMDERTLAPVKPGTGMIVAVKKLKLDSFQGHREWLAEVNYLGQLSHPNLVKLIGYCLEDEQRLLVYEYMPRGSLENHLFRRSSNIQPLPWNLRMKVALEAARGLAFLHGDQAKVIYRDFKTSNILLDSEYNAKLSGFGFAKDGPSGDISHVSTRLMGMQGYAAPEYLATGHLTAKSDVYSYGVVLLELMSGKRALDRNRPPGQHNLVEWSRPYISTKSGVIYVLDLLLGARYSLPAAQKMAALALQCLLMDARCRPGMDQVVTVLEGLQYG